jgi:hypothetical protein
MHGSSQGKKLFLTGPAAGKYWLLTPVNDQTHLNAMGRCRFHLKILLSDSRPPAKFPALYV